MKRHLPLLPCFLGLALCVWRPEWVSVAVLALCLMFAMYLDNRGRRADDVEDLAGDVADLRQAIQGESVKAALRDEQSAADDAGAILMRKKATDDVEALRHDMKTLRGDMEAIRVAMGTAPGRARL